uniref:DNA-directed RNA polymerase subunit n=1 Tax=Eucampia antarctica TaxID=49252 RepID=A0A6U0SGG9_9STRA|mmetsp:Transcript_26423/g.25259  ORF Transcript_26423/g.25259 Transcript_26423/m.25259 type:complete len:120 (+) Transcript_26423:246-605(+)
MGWPFCPSCHYVLSVDGSGAIRCSVCPYESNLSSMDKDDYPKSRTVSTDTAVPLWAKSDEEQAALRATKEPSRATVEEPCIKCGHGEVGFYCLQLRSVDEGQTVFYECPKCKHTWSLNN